MVDHDVGGTGDRASDSKEDEWAYYRLHCEKHGMVDLAADRSVDCAPDPKEYELPYVRLDC